jgi:hypothetical protein
MSRDIGIKKPVNLKGTKEHPVRKRKKKQNKVELHEELYLDIDDRVAHAQILGEL